MKFCLLKEQHFLKDPIAITIIIVLLKYIEMFRVNRYFATLYLLKYISYVKDITQRYKMSLFFDTQRYKMSLFFVWKNKIFI